MAIEIVVTGASAKAAKKLTAAIQASVPAGAAMQIQTATSKDGHSVTLTQQSKAEMLTDEIIHLELKLRSIGAAEILKRQGLIKQELQLIAADEPKDQMVVFTGTIGTVELSACKRETEIVNKGGLLSKLTKKVSAEAAQDAMTFNMTKLKKLLSENEIMEYAETEYGGRITKVKPAVEVGLKTS